MDAADRAELIRRYRAGYARVEAALAGAADAALDRRPAEGAFSAREVVHHLADSEMTSAIRLRRLLVEEAPLIHGYDENAFAQRLFYAERPLEAALLAFRAARETTAELLERMTEEDWRRAGTHTESGRYGADDWLRIYAAHAEDHARQIDEALALHDG